jgi:hypothetical protein
MNIKDIQDMLDAHPTRAFLVGWTNYEGDFLMGFAYYVYKKHPEIWDEFMAYAGLECDHGYLMDMIEEYHKGFWPR